MVSITTITVSDVVGAQLQARAAARGVSVEELLAELAAGLDNGPAVVTVGDDPLEAFIGGSASGDPGWASTDIKVLRRELAERRAAEGIENL